MSDAVVVLAAAVSIAVAVVVVVVAAVVECAASLARLRLHRARLLVRVHMLGEQRSSGVGAGEKQQQGSLNSSRSSRLGGGRSRAIGCTRLAWPRLDPFRAIYETAPVRSRLASSPSAARPRAPACPCRALESTAAAGAVQAVSVGLVLAGRLPTLFRQRSPYLPPSPAAAWQRQHDRVAGTWFRKMAALRSPSPPRPAAATALPIALKWNCHSASALGRSAAVEAAAQSSHGRGDARAAAPACIMPTSAPSHHSSAHARRNPIRN